MKIFLPPIDSRWRFADDWNDMVGGFLHRSDNQETLYATPVKLGIGEWKQATGDTTAEPAHGPRGWVERYWAWVAAERERIGCATFEAGTIIQIERYHVSRSGEDQITVLVIIAPDPRLTPKKRGGKMRGRGRLYFSLAEFNSLPQMEEFTDVLS